MLYLDSSALVKKYVREAGSDAVLAKFRSGERVFVSQITFAECLSAFARKFKHGELSRASFQHSCDDFVWDWMGFLERVEVESKTMTSVRELVMELRAADAIQLSTAIWLNGMCRLAPEKVGGDRALEFIAADGNLIAVAQRKGLNVFDPTGTP